MTNKRTCNNEVYSINEVRQAILCILRPNIKHKIRWVIHVLFFLNRYSQKETEH